MMMAQNLTTLDRAFAITLTLNDPQWFGRTEDQLKRDAAQLFLRVIRRGLRRERHEYKKAINQQARREDAAARTIIVEGRALLVERAETVNIGLQFRSRYTGRLLDTRERASVYVLANGTFGPLNVFSKGKRRNSKRKNIWHRNGVIEAPKLPALTSEAQLSANTQHSIKLERAVDKMGQRDSVDVRANTPRPSEWPRFTKR
jgi:hypothetical protein